MRKNKNSKIFIFSATRLIIFVIATCLLVFSLKYSTQIETIINIGLIKRGTVLDEEGLQVHFVDVGQAEAVIVEFPDGKTMLVDTGTTSSAPKLIDYINNNIFEKTTNPYFDYMLLTHSHADHIGGAVAILEEFQVNTVFRPEIYATYNNTEDYPEGATTSNTQIYARVIKKVYEEPYCEVIFSFSGIIITQEEGAEPYTLTFLSPLEHVYTGADAENAFSPIILLEYKGKSIMLTGDAVYKNELEVLQAFDLGKIDVLNLAHHGSKTSSSVEFLTTIQPTYVVISVGKYNSYNHPHQEVINRLLYTGVKEQDIFRTDTHGNILVNITTQRDIAIFIEVESLANYLHWDKIAGILFIASFVLCFIYRQKNI